MIKVMFLPLNFNDVVQSGVVDAFTDAGCEVKVFDYFYIKSKGKSSKDVQTDLIREVSSFNPDLLHLQIQHTDVINAETIRKIKKAWPKIIITSLSQDARNYVVPQFRDIGKVADYSFITSTTQLKMYEKEIGKKVYYWQIGYDPKLYYRAPYNIEKFEFDSVFIANYNNKENYPGTNAREKLCRVMVKEFGSRFGLFGGSWPSEFKSKGSLHQRKLRDTYNKSFSSISVNHYNDLSDYFSDRLLMCMACGRPTISFRFPGWETYFTDNCDLVMVDKVEDIPKRIRFLLKNRDLAEYIGKSGAEKVLAEHTYLSRIQELLHLIGLK